MDKEGPGSVLDAIFASRPAARARLLPVTVLVASQRETLPYAALKRLSRAYGIRVLEHRVPATHLLFAALQQHRPDVLLLDDSILDALDAASTASMRLRFPGLRVLIVGDEMRCGMAEEVLLRRLHGFLPAASTPEACLRAIRAVSRGELWLPRALLSRALAQAMQASVSAMQAPDERRPLPAEGLLTGRETQIAEFVRQGLTNKEIARRLGIMEDTVKKHLQGVFGKLGVRRRALVALHQAGAA